MKVTEEGLIYRKLNLPILLHFTKNQSEGLVNCNSEQKGKKYNASIIVTLFNKSELIEKTAKSNQPGCIISL